MIQLNAKQCVIVFFRLHSLQLAFRKPALADCLLLWQIMQCRPEGWLSGQKQRTVNPPVYTYAGSNPAPSTIIL